MADPQRGRAGGETVIPENDKKTGRRVTGRPLRWKLGDPIGATLTALYGRLAGLRNDLPALRSPAMYPQLWEVWQTRFNPVGVGVDVERQLVIYHRWASVPGGVENVVVVLNFADTQQMVEVPFPVPGRWTDRLAGFAGGSDWSVTSQAPPHQCRSDRTSAGSSTGSTPVLI